MNTTTNIEKETDDKLRTSRTIKPYLVLRYLIKNSDKDKLVRAADIVAYLEDDCAINSKTP